MTRKAVEVINDHPADQPLFLYLAYQTAHMPMQVATDDHQQHHHQHQQHQCVYSSFILSPLLVQKPPAVYRKQYKRQTRVYQSDLQQPPKAIYRAATITVSRQSDEYIVIVSLNFLIYLTHH